ncbi:MAG: proton-conducting transporter membrane subunit [Rickettsiaceae bacterium]|nr:proton-conducting transporter membrane subunit [Rickettsiaceae bacterium]
MIEALLATSIFITILSGIRSNSIFHKLTIILSFVVVIILSILICKIRPEEEIKFLINENVSLYLRPNKLGSIFIVLVASLWPISYFYSLYYIKVKNEGRVERFGVFLNASFCASIALGLAGNLMTMYVFYELLTLLTLPLVGHVYSPAASHGLRQYINYLFSSSVCLFLPTVIFVTYACDGGYFNGDSNGILHNIWHGHKILILLAFMYGIAKTAIFPLHDWLIYAMAANYPTSAILHGVLVVNSGIFCLTKILEEIVGQQTLETIINGYHMIYFLPMIGLAYSGTMGIIETSAKKILAWSTICYLNLMLVMLLSNLGSEIVIKQLIIHSYAKLSLFLLLGYLYTKEVFFDVDDLAGVIKNQKIIFLLFVLTSLILSGYSIFYFGEFKDVVKNIAASNYNLASLLSIILSSFFSIIYLGRIMISMSYGATSDKFSANGNLDSDSDFNAESNPESNRVLFCLVCTAALGANIVALYVEPIYDYLCS